MSIVVGVDGSEGSKAALRWALEEARLRRTPLELVYAWPIPQVALGYGFGPALDQEYIDSLRDAAARLLDEVLAEVSSAAEGVEVSRSAIEGSAAAVLVEKAEGAELLVVGSRGLGGFSELLLGSVGHQCVQHAPCPVVIVRHPRTD